MAMFGFMPTMPRAPSGPTDLGVPPQQQPLSGADKLAMFGAMLKDTVGGFNGEDSNNVLTVQKAVQARKDLAQKQAIQQQIASLLGPQAGANPTAAPRLLASGGDDQLAGGTNAAAPPTATSGGLDINDPRLPALAVKAQQAGVDISTLLDVLKAQQPDVRYDRGFGYNGKTGSAVGGYHPELDKGQEPVFDQNGRIVGVRNMDGSVQSAAEMAGAVSGAQERAKAGYDLTSVPQSDGSTRMMPRLQAVGALGGGFGGSPDAGGGPQLGVSQSPAAQALETKRADTQAQREAAQPQAYAGLVDQGRASELTANTIHEILGDVRDPKTGAWKPSGQSMLSGWTTGMGANLAALNGTPAHNLQAKLDQIRAATGFDELSKMRQQSPTGGALGAVSEQENRLLQSVRGSLDQGQGSRQMEQALRGQLAQLEKLSGQRRQLYQSQFGGAQPNAGGGRASAPPAPASPQQRQRGAVYNTPRGPMTWTGTGWLLAN